MFRWLDKQNQDEKLDDHGKVVTSFWFRLGKLDEADDELREATAAAFVLCWADVVEIAGGIEGFRKLERGQQKELIVKLIDYEVQCLEDGPKSEAYGAELLSYYLSMIASHSDEDEQRMRPVLCDLARLVEDDFEFDQS